MATKRKPKRKSPSAAQLKSDGLWQLERRKRQHKVRVLAFQRQQQQIKAIAERAISQALSETLLDTVWERGIES